MAMIMSMQRLNEREGREGGRELGKYLQTRQRRQRRAGASLRWLQEQIEAHTFSQSRKREGETLLGREGGLRSAQVE